MFPHVYEETIKDGKDGKLGKDIQEFLKEHPDGALNAEQDAYRCGSCGRYASEPVLTMYLPKDPGKKPEKEKGRWSVSFPGDGLNYVSSMELKSDYKVYKVHPHFCAECGSRMKRMTARELKADLCCPECGEQLETSTFLWD